MSYKRRNTNKRIYFKNIIYEGDLMKNFVFPLAGKTYEIQYEAIPKLGDYDGIIFYIKVNNNSFRYVVKISGSLWAMLVNQNIFTEADAAEMIINVFIQYTKEKLEQGVEKNLEFMFTSDSVKDFKEFLTRASIVKKSGRQTQTVSILKYLNDVHYQLFNKDDIPVSLRILSEDLKIDQKRIKDLLLSLRDEGKVEVVDQGNKNIFARITHKGIEDLEK